VNTAITEIIPAKLLLSAAFFNKENNRTYKVSQTLLIFTASQDQRGQY